MRLSLPAPQRRHLHSASVQNFRLSWPAHSAFETRPTQIPRGPPQRQPFLRSLNSQRWQRCFARQRPVALGPLGLVEAPRARSFRLRTRLRASRALRQFPPRGEWRPPVSSDAAVTRAATPRASAGYELFPLCVYSCWYHSLLRPLNGFAGELRVLVNGRSHSPCYRMSPSVREKCCPLRLDIVS